MTKFDLHLHSNNSDGSASVKELVEKVRSENIKVFSLTDHDTVNGIEDIYKYLPKDFTFFQGVELTCKVENINCHILGYKIDYKNRTLLNLIEKGKVLRKQKLETRIKYLKDVWNIELNQEELDWLYSRKSVVKTHIANILVKRGLAPDNVSAMKKYLDNCKTGNTKFSGEEAISAILSAGGIPVWAHPLGGEGEEHISEEEFANQLKIMMKCGIQGIECYYSRYSLKEAELLVKYAKENNLYITGGSDWHGSNKTVPIGRLNTEGKEVDFSSIMFDI